jgi:primosomal protein N''
MNILETLQKIAATTQRLDTAMAEIERERGERERFENAVISRIERLEIQLGEIRERLVRLEVSREADRSQMAAELARFRAEVERAELQLTRILQGAREPRSLPPSQQPDPQTPAEEKNT